MRIFVLKLFLLDSSLNISIMKQIIKNIAAFCVILVLGICSSCTQPSEGRERMNFDRDWTFHLGEITEAASPDFDDSSWRRLNLPHDWAIEGDFSQENPSGTGGGALPGGIGWYRKTFTVGPEDEGRKVFIDFDGVYMNSEVFINGTSLGKRPYGYISFRYDLTPYLRYGAENVLAVRVDNAEQPNSRWYSGCGIYRHVWLVKTDPVHVAHWGTYATAQLEGEKATLKMQTTIQNESEASRKVTLQTCLVDQAGTEVAKAVSELEIQPGDTLVGKQDLDLTNPTLWTLEHPYLYTIRTTLLADGKKPVDTYETTFGFRTFRFDAAEGFILNGKPTKINGVCLHHDQGCLGAAVNTRAIERQLEILKEMGCNGIRCSHNPPAPELLDLCDRMGFIVMDEAFDMWRKKKTAHDYARYFDAWHERDLTDLVTRDRNHPSVFMWSIGNEVLEQWSDAAADTLSLAEANLILNFGHSASQLANDKMSVNSLLCAKLAGIVKELDPTRPVTAGCNEPNPNNHLFRSGALDIIGFNYHDAWFKDVPANFPGKPFLVTESVSGLMTRGYYKMPSDKMIIAPDRWDRPYTDSTFSCSSYDNCHVPWGNYHEGTWKLVKENPFISGQYIWTGFDYIGEPTPYGWPARSSYFGIVDLAGFPKDIYYMYQSEWTDKEVLHLFPHWNWKPGQPVDMWVYYNHADEVELFVNGKSQGAKRKADGVFHVSWRVAFEPGTVEVVAKKDGKVVRKQHIQTAGEPAEIRLVPDRTKLDADGTDLSYVTVEILDKDGNLCPWADNLVQFEVEGAGFIAGVDNGCPFSMERFKDNKRKAFYGKCLVVLQNNGEQGAIRLKATSEGLENGEAEVVCEL